jgi:hypothetical protein
LLVDSLQDSSCVLTRIGLLHEVTNAAGRHWGTDPAAVKIMHAVYSKCFEWLTRSRSDSEMEELRKSACYCTDDISRPVTERGAHKLGRQAIDRSASPGWTMVLSWILLAFDQQPSALDLAAQGMHTLSRRTSWPRSIISILPHGPERTLHALLRLFQTVPAGQRREICSALERIITLCHPLVARLLVRSSRFLRCCIECFIDMPIPIPSNNVNSAARNATIVSEVERFTRLMMIYVFFSLNETERLVFQSQEPDTLLRAYARCLEICKLAKDLMELPMYHRWFSDLGLSSQRLEDTGSHLLYLSTRLCEDFPSLRGTHVSVDTWDRIIHDIAALRIVPSSRVVWERFQLAMHQLEVRQRCSAPGCLRTRADGRLHRCAQCKRVLYCSRACQKVAWTHNIAHRDVCKSIAFLCDAYGTPERDVYNYKPPDGPGDTASYEEIGRQVLDHFTRLTKLNIATPSSTSTYPLHAYLR